MPKQEDRWIDREAAVKLLGKVCNFLAYDDSGVADFKILDGKEAVLISAYTGAFFLQDLDHKFKFRSTASPLVQLNP